MPKVYSSPVAASIPIDTITGTAATEVQTALLDAMNPSYIATATGNTTTASTTDVLMSGMSVVVPQSGTYAISFQTSLSHGSNNANIWVSVYAGGAKITTSEIRFNRANVSLVGPINLGLILASVQGNAAARTIEIRWRTSTGTATANDIRYFSLIKVRPPA